LKFIFNIILLDIHFLFSADFPEIDIINIKLSVFLHKLFSTSVLNSLHVLLLHLQLNLVSAKMYG